MALRVYKLAFVAIFANTWCFEVEFFAHFGFVILVDYCFGLEFIEAMGVCTILIEFT